MKRIIILSKDESSSQVRFSYVMWATVPVARQVPLPSFVSAFSGVTTAEAKDLRDGKVFEEQGHISQAVATPFTATEVALQQTWAAFQAAVNLANPSVNYGTFWDGTTWTLAGTA